MKMVKTVKSDAMGQFIKHLGVEYRPSVVSEFSDGQAVDFSLDPIESSDSRATVSANGITETWTPNV